MRPQCLLLVFLLAAGTSLAEAVPSLETSSAHGRGAFVFLAPDGVLQATPDAAEAWTLAAPHGRLVLVDDKREYEVENPANPGQLLFSSANHTSRTTSLDGATVRLERGSDEDATTIWMPQGAPLRLDAGLDGTFTLDHMPETVLERSHMVSQNASFSDRFYYEIKQGPALRLVSSTDLSSTLSGPLRVYLWGIDVTVEQGGSTQTYRTGHYDEDAAPGVPQGGTSHFVHAFLELPDAEVSLPGVPASMYAARLEVESHGTIKYEDVTGTIATTDGSLQVANGTVLVETGKYSWDRSDGGVRVRTDAAPDSVEATGVVAAPQATPVAAWAWGLAAMLLAASGFMAPALQGMYVRSRGDATPRTWRALRAEGFAFWATKADMHGHKRLAAFCAGRAVHYAPKDPGAHMEYGILLQQAGNATKALREHGIANALFERGPETGNTGLNAYQASVSCVQLGRLQQAVAWLQRAVECDPGLAAAAERDPLLARLRGLADFRAIVVHAPS